MFFNLQTRRWEPHPLCTCHRDPCYCPNLPPLNKDGQPIGEYGVLGPDYPVVQKAKKREDAA